MTFYIDGTERTGRTEILAGTASDAALVVYNRYFGGIRIVFVRWYHLYCPDRAVSGTVATFDTIGQRHTIFLYPYGMSYLDG